MVDGKADVKRLYSDKHLGTVQGFSFDSKMLPGQLTVNITVQRLGVPAPQKQEKEERGRVFPVGRPLDLDGDSFPDVLVNGKFVLDGNLLRGRSLKADLDGDTFPDVLVNGQLHLDGNLLRGKKIESRSRRR